jgi:hypothetical protein
VRFRSIRNSVVLSLGMVAAFAAAVAGDKLAEDPQVLLDRIRSRTAAHLSQLPNYTCHEVVDRMIRRGSNWNHIDTVEFEVAFVGRRELFARPGEQTFGDRSATELVAGTMSDGVLGSQIDMVFAKDTTEFRYAGTAKKDGRNTYRYDLKVSQENSGFRVKHGSAQAIVPFEGSVWADAETFDLVRVDIKVNRIPSYVGVLSIEKSMHYQMMHIADDDFLLPRKAELTATDDMGNYSLNRISLDACRVFTGESTIKYGSPAEGSASRERPDRPDR